MLHNKESDKTSEKELNQTKIVNMSDEEFKVIIVNMPTGLERRVEKLRPSKKRKNI